MINTIVAIVLLMTVVLHDRLEGIVELEYWFKLHICSFRAMEPQEKYLISLNVFLLNEN